jgi:small redox-active disulfide protein 2
MDKEMKKIEVLGIGCPNCKKTEKIIRRTVEGMGWSEGVDFTIRKITNPAEIADRGVLATPGVSIDGVVVSKGKIPKPKVVQSWFE